MDSLDGLRILPAVGYVNKPRGPLCTSLHLLTFLQVEGEAQGADEGIQKLLKVLESGPPAATVTSLEKSEIDVKDGESSYTAQ